ncbi:hypothetical protein HUO13_11885 [Saccharopolyspora erythraea]|uniref:DNA polymerase n=1 Tax=Saccharopolyspora erythraea TaxID=1836 RepID=UPI001BF15826|nr:DNA polymerase [Saccharopolyspora erythraea]QUH01415.1 hypothetical protein HUO13_11885 [Saccharopolyspora erythraea]
MTQKALFLDIESESADLLWSLPPENFVRLTGYAWGANGDVVLTEDLEDVRAAIREADVIVGHRIHAFDLIGIFGKDSTEPLELALADKVFDTWVHATLVHPAPSSYVDRNGNPVFVDGPERAKKWFSLDNQAYQLGVAGKSHDLKALAKEFGGFGNIPTSDPRFRDYLRQDVIATRDVARRLSQLGSPTDPYALREQINAAIDAQNSRNGWRIDVERAKARVAELEEIQRTTLEMLHERYGFPTEGKAPLRTKAGKEAVLRALAEVGIAEDKLPRTKNGGPSLGGEGLVETAKKYGSDEALELAQAIARIGGLRPLAQSALDNVQPDGRVHVDIHTLQRSGRKSTQNPGLTVWTSRDPKGAVEKSYFIPNEDDHVLVELDYSQADARIVAAYSGDEAFKERFAPGADAHLLTAHIVWGADVVGYDKKNPVTKQYRDTAKAQNHAYSYNAGALTLSRNAGVPLETSKLFVAQMKRAYPRVEKWKTRVIKEAQRYGYVANWWGRRMIVERDREFTQAPALYGQSGTREIVVDGLIRMARRDVRLITFLVAQVHDALVFSLPAGEVEELTAVIRECMETTWSPGDGIGQEIHFPVEAGRPAKDWQEAGH